MHVIPNIVSGAFGHTDTWGVDDIPSSKESSIAGNVSKRDIPEVDDIDPRQIKLRSGDVEPTCKQSDTASDVSGHARLETSEVTPGHVSIFKVRDTLIWT